MVFFPGSKKTSTTTTTTRIDVEIRKLKSEFDKNRHIDLFSLSISRSFNCLNKYVFHILQFCFHWMNKKKKNSWANKKKITFKARKKWVKKKFGKHCSSSIYINILKKRTYTDKSQIYHKHTHSTIYSVCFVVVFFLSFFGTNVRHTRWRTTEPEQWPRKKIHG